ncbi:MAG: hypothetical protein LUQ16_00875 [Methanomassiliicoccales archaeon]|jgi:hypothetical protein|nr:hypothetical protein [Methanomassiliicoccales archaeon]MDD1755614.1 hypothetical protein [Methanomassiliicoccales archaeon]
MEKEFLVEALRLSKGVRHDLNELTRLWSFRFFENIHSASDFIRITGFEVGVIQSKLELLEKCIKIEDMATISNEEWPIYNLVNYYDHLIDLVHSNIEAIGKEEKWLQSLKIWRNTAGQFAQMVCSMEDAI